MNIKTRAATIQDLQSIYRLICELENTQYPIELFTNLFTVNVNDSRIGYYVAEMNESVVGFGSIYINKLLHHCGNVSEIQELIVSQDFQHKNIGKILLNTLIEWSTKQGALQVEVTCNITRIEAHEFYKVNGFTHTHQKFVLKCD